MEIDYGAVVMALRAHILSKRSHGQDELLRVLANAELDNQLPSSEQGRFDDRPLPARRPADGPPLTAVSHG